MSDLTAIEVENAVLDVMAIWLPGTRYVESIGEVQHRLTLCTYDLDAQVYRVEQESVEFDESPQLFRVRVIAEELQRSDH